MFIIEDGLGKGLQHSDLYDKIYNVKKLDSKQTREIIRSEFRFLGAKNSVQIICFDEEPLLIAAKLREEFNLIGHKPPEIMPFKDKALMKKLVQVFGIQIPSYIDMNNINNMSHPQLIYRSMIKKLGNKIILKPKSKSGSIGVEVIEDFNHFFEWLKKRKYDLEDYIAEQFIDGVMFHCDSIVKNEKIIFASVGKQSIPCLKFMDGYNLGSILYDESDPVIKKILNFNKKVFNALPKIDGVRHLEVFVQENGEIVFLEIAARPPGGLIVPAIEKVFGINLYEFALCMQLDILPPSLENINKKRNCGWFYIPKRPGTIEKIFSLNTDCQYELQWNTKLGDKISKPVSVNDRACSVLFWDNDFCKVMNDFNYMRTFQFFKVN